MPTQVALLITDVVDSTRLTESLGDAAMADVWAAHDRIARDLLHAWGGREIDKTDGMLTLFDTVEAAARYAAAYHEAIAARDLPVVARAGIHHGAVVLRPNPPADVARGAKPVEVDGIALPVTARVMSIARGRQTLLSAEAARALGDVEALPLRTIGHWQLQGIDEPVELFEQADARSALGPPPDAEKAFRVVWHRDRWLPLKHIAHSLPAERDRYVGRADALDDLAQRLRGGARLVSVLGIGGIGKTRFAVRTGWNTLALFPGGVWFCDLAQASTLDGVHYAVAQGLGITLTGDAPGRQIADVIAARERCLVVLDNFEQVTALAAQTVGPWLDRAPRASFVVTTRTVLNLPGEDVFELDPLDDDAAASLFRLRAASARRGYAPTAADGAAVQRLVDMLDGLPLAIELAAARVRLMSPATMLARLRSRFDIAGAGPARGHRHATLRSTFDWSWELLAEREKAALACLSVFAGSFSIDAAAAVVDDEEGIVDTLQSLVDKSFVRTAGNERFVLLESVREYAAEHLGTEGRFEGSGPERAGEVRRAHWAHFGGHAVPGAPDLPADDADNAVAACRNAIDANVGAGASLALAAAWSALRLTGPYRVAADLAARVVAMASLSPIDGALARWVSGSARDMLGDVSAARQDFDEGLRLADGGRPDVVLRLLIAAGGRQTLDGDLDRAASSLLRAETLARSTSSRAFEALACNALGRLMDHQGRVVEARDCYQRALTLAREIGDRRLEGGLLGNLGGIAYDLGEAARAQNAFERGLEIAIEFGDRRWEGNAHSNLGLLLQQRGDRAGARHHFDQALAKARQVGHARLEYTVQCNLAILLIDEGAFSTACDHLRQAIEGAQSSSDRRSEGQFRGYLAVALARAGNPEHGVTELDVADRLLRAMSDRMSHAQLLCQRAEVACLAGRIADARHAFDTASTLADELGCGPQSELERSLAALRPLIRGGDPD